MNRTSTAAFGIFFVASLLLWADEAPVFSSGGPDAAAYGEAEHYPVGTAETMFKQQYMVGAFTHYDAFFPFHTVLPAATAWAFRRPATAPDISYFHAGSRYRLQDYLSHLPITGLLLAKNDEILFEGYQYARTDKDLFTSQSTAKTMVAMLMGIAVSEGKIQSINDPASKYVPELKNSDYGDMTIRNLLHMSSGITCKWPDESPDEITIQALTKNCKTELPQGTHFHYSAADSTALGLIVQRSVGTNLASYLQARIWQQIGTESKATWTVNKAGDETPYCCFNATLRDYARFARLLAWSGAWNGKQLIPSKWIQDATTVSESDPQLMPGKPVPFFGYGYQVWILPGPRRMFALLGANGQRIFVDPQSRLYMVQTAVTLDATDRAKDAETIGLWLSLVHTYGG